MFMKYVVEIPSGVDMYCEFEVNICWDDFEAAIIKEAKAVAEQTNGQWMLIVRFKENSGPARIAILCDEIEDMNDKYLNIAGHSIIKFEEVDEEEFNEMTNDGKENIFPIER